MNPKVLAIILLWSIPMLLLAQEEVRFDGADLEFETLEDYKNYEGKILILIHWLKSNSLTHPNWKDGEAVFSKWLIETPSLSIYYDRYVYFYTQKNPKLLVLFLAGWTDYALRTPVDHYTQLDANLAGINTLIDYYLKGKEFGINEDQKIEKLIRKRKEAKLHAFIKMQIK